MLDTTLTSRVLTFVLETIASESFLLSLVTLNPPLDVRPLSNEVP